MYNKLDGLFLCLRDSETPSANLDEKSRTPLNNAELRNATTIPLPWVLLKSGPTQQGFYTVSAQKTCRQHAADTVKPLRRNRKPSN